MAWPTHARSNPSGERPRLSGHTFDIAPGRLDLLLGSQHRQQDSSTFGSFENSEPVNEWTAHDAHLIAAL